MAENSEITQSYSVEIDENWDISQLYLVALVQQFDEENLTEREILNAEEIKLMTALESENVTGANDLFLDAEKENNKLVVYPNPISETATKISFHLPNTKETSIKVLNLQGETVATLRHENMNKGWHTIDWKKQNNDIFAAKKGLYLLQIQQDNFLLTEKIIIL